VFIVFRATEDTVRLSKELLSTRRLAERDYPFLEVPDAQLSLGQLRFLLDPKLNQ
jgi:hypothetical protein